MGSHRKYSDEEKLQMVSRSLKGQSLQEISQETGIHPVLLSRWRKEYVENGQFGHKKQSSSALLLPEEAQKELERLKSRLEEKNLEVAVLRDMLKKTAEPPGKNPGSDEMACHGLASSTTVYYRRVVQSFLLPTNDTE